MNTRVTQTAVGLVALAVASVYGCKKEEPATASPEDAKPTASASNTPADDPGGSADGPDEPYDDPLAAVEGPEPKPPDMTAEEQADAGEIVYDANCASCHGQDGRGKKRNPPVLGPKAMPVDPPKGAKKRTGQFETAFDLRSFVREFMPPKKAGKLSDADYDAVVAFLLRGNGVELEGPVWYQNATDIPVRSE